MPAVRKHFTCTVAGCDSPHQARGFCDTHYTRWRRHGDPLVVNPAGPKHRPLSERLLDSVSVGDGCWLWQGCVRPDGRGHLGAGGREGPTVLAHRAMYELLVGEIPDGLQLDHLCRTPRCVNPDHLEPVTHAENLARQGLSPEEHLALAG